MITFVLLRSPDRMTNYERVFLNTIKKQKAKFEGQNPPESITKLTNVKRSKTDAGARLRRASARRHPSCSPLGAIGPPLRIADRDSL